MPGTQKVHQEKIIHCFAGTPSSSTSPWVSLKNFNHLTIIIGVTNATTVTGSAITLQQATAVAGTGAKTLAFTKMWAALDLAASDLLVETAVTSNTFTTLSTNSKRALYVIEIDAEMLDMDNDFDCVKVLHGDATAATLAVTYILSGCRYAGNVATIPSAIVD